MTSRQLPTVVIGMLLALFVGTTRAEACLCGSAVPLSVQANTAASVFIGTVDSITGGTWESQTNADGSMTSRFAYRPLATVRVTRLLKGTASPIVSIRGGGECDVTLAPGQSWLLYIGDVASEYRATKCGRSRLVDDAQADLSYFEKQAAGVPVAVVYGDVFRRCADRDSQPQLCSLEDSVEVVAVGRGERISVTTDRFGPYQLVLPPGAFGVWIERGGKRLSTEIWVDEKPGQGRRLSASELLELRADEERRVLLISVPD